MENKCEQAHNLTVPCRPLCAALGVYQPSTAFFAKVYLTTHRVHLLSGIMEDNLHDACDTGEAVGNENW
jgi:hypothetical protein